MPVFNHIPKIEDDMQGATTENEGKSGLVPAPAAGETHRALMADGTWKIPPSAINASLLSGCDIYNPRSERNISIASVETVDGVDILNIGTVINLNNKNNHVLAFLSYQHNYNNTGGSAVVLRQTGEAITKLILGDGNNITEIPNRTILDNIARTGSEDAGPYFAPTTTDIIRLGHGNAKWSAVYAASSEIVTSDRNLKDDINSLTEVYEQLFADLEPSTFKFKNGDSNRTHAGFIAQDVEKALEKNGLSALDFAGFCKDQKTKIITDENGEEKEVPVEGEYIYSLRYEEFIALNTHMIQQLYHKVESLEQKLRENGIEV